MSKNIYNNLEKNGNSCSYDVKSRKSIYEKAKTLKAKRITESYYEVGTHQVIINESKISCDCEYFTIHGGKTRICSHIIAAILERMRT